MPSYKKMAVYSHNVLLGPEFGRAYLPLFTPWALFCRLPRSNCHQWWLFSLGYHGINGAKPATGIAANGGLWRHCSWEDALKDVIFDGGTSYNFMLWEVFFFALSHQYISKSDGILRKTTPGNPSSIYNIISGENNYKPVKNDSYSFSLMSLR